MASPRKLYSWDEIDDIEPKAGIYAWYCKHSFSEFDIRQLLAALAAVPGGEAAVREKLVERFLQTHLFSVFVEEPYAVTATGPLKPPYRGEMHHVQPVTEGLVDRIAQEPGRLWELKKVLEEAVPEFASPIYIGMSDNLNSRVRRHKKLIETYRKGEVMVTPGLVLPPAEQADHSFARDVARRGFGLNRLVVAVRQINTPGNVNVDAENILNRINYPLCGRN